MSEERVNYVQSGQTLLEEGDYLGAVDAFTKALRLGLGDLAEIYVQRGEAYGYLEDWPRAMDDFNEALRHNPYLATAYNERGSLRRFLNDLEGAVEDHGFAIQVDPTLYEAYYNRALSYEILGELDLAEADLSQTIKLHQGTALAYEARGRVRAARKNYDGAIEDYQRYLRMGGGREYDNHSDIQSLIISLRIARFFRRLLKWNA